ncbi:MAG: sigma factor, partial [Oscillospiraceae bacterium]|nr:sigma factor [Oscillospiraceae bacterium]
MHGKVEICGVNTSKLKVLSNEKMRELLLETKRGNAAARQELIEGNLRLVLSVIQKFSGRGENPDDLFQVGCIGLLKAVENFDATK